MIVTFLHGGRYVPKSSQLSHLGSVYGRSASFLTGIYHGSRNIHIVFGYTRHFSCINQGFKTVNQLLQGNAVCWSPVAIERTVGTSTGMAVVYGMAMATGFDNIEH